MTADNEGTCPVGGSWYTCTGQTPTFFGCCTSDPCNGVGCPAADIRAAGMGVSAGSVNGSSFWPNVNCGIGQWWTCPVQMPSFQGCCDSTPCNGKGCPVGQLHPAAFSTLPPSLQTSFSQSLTPSSTPSATSSAGVSPASQVVSGSSSSPTAAIIGGVAGGIFVLVMLGIIICLSRRKRNQMNVIGTNSNPLIVNQSTNQNLGATSELESPRWNRFTCSQSSPMTPPPQYGQSPNQGAIGELITTGHSSVVYSETHGLCVQFLGLQEADAQSGHPNHLSRQREWSRGHLSELPDNPASGSQTETRRHAQLVDRDSRGSYPSP